MLCIRTYTYILCIRIGPPGGPGLAQEMAPVGMAKERLIFAIKI